MGPDRNEFQRIVSYSSNGRHTPPWSLLLFCVTQNRPRMQCSLFTQAVSQGYVYNKQTIKDEIMSLSKTKSKFTYRLL